MGGAGVVDAFRRLRAAGLVELQRDYVPYLEHSAVAPPDFDDAGAERSLWMGEVGVRLVLQRLSPSAENLKRLAELVDANAQAEQQELMWGSPGTILIGRELGLDVDEAVDWLRAQRAPDGLWMQDLYGNQRRHIGPAHGFAGCALALADGDGRLGGLAPVRDRRGRPDQLAARRRRAVPARAHAADPDAVVPRRARASSRPSVAGSTTISRSAAASSRGAPGRSAKGRGSATAPRATATRCSCCSSRRATSCGLRAPARSRCTRSPRSSARAEHGRGRYTLWTGDAGTALYLADCLDGTPRLPLP